MQTTDERDVGWWFWAFYKRWKWWIIAVFTALTVWAVVSGGGVRGDGGSLIAGWVFYAAIYGLAALITAFWRHVIIKRFSPARHARLEHWVSFPPPNERSTAPTTKGVVVGILVLIGLVLVLIFGHSPTQ